MNNGRREANQRRIMEDGGRKEGRKVRMTGGTKVKRTRKGACNVRAARQAKKRASERAGEVGITGAELRSPPDGRTGTGNGFGRC